MQGRIYNLGRIFRPRRIRRKANWNTYRFYLRWGRCCLCQTNPTMVASDDKVQVHFEIRGQFFHPWLLFRALFATESIVPALCGDIGVCEPMRRSRFYKVKDVEITCEVCGIGIENLARAFQSEKNINRVIDLLSGEAFCTVSFLEKKSKTA